MLTNRRRHEEYMSRTSSLNGWFYGLALATTVLVFCGVKQSIAQSTNKPTADAKANSDTLPTIRIRAGSKTPYKDSEGNVWQGDVESKDGGFEGGEIVDRPNDIVIQNTKDQGLYRSE